MNERKHHVLKTAHQLFIEKGFQATSIQDILEFSGISKGTFYNYFSSKNELLIAIFKTLFREMEEERDKLLIGEDRSDPEHFIKQVELQMKANRANKLVPLFEEVFFSNDAELKQFLKAAQIKNIRWIHDRLVDLFDEQMHPYLLDAAIMFIGILQQNTRYYTMAHGEDADLQSVVRFAVARIKAVTEDAAASGDQLLPPDMLQKWLPEDELDGLDLRNRICAEISSLKASSDAASRELLDFIQDELLHSRTPRKGVIESVFSSLEKTGKIDLSNLQDLLDECLEGKSF